MPNGVRHLVGVVIGLVVTPLILVGLSFGTERLSLMFRTYILDVSARPWAAFATMLGVAVVLGVLMGSRISPLASLIPGIALSAIGLLWMFAPRFALEHTMGKLPRTLDRGYSVLGPYGVLAVIGVALLVASLPSSRWAARPGTARPQPGPPQQFGGSPVPPYGHAGPQGHPQGQPGPQGQAGPQGQPPLPQRQPGQHPLHGPPPGAGAPPAPYQPAGSQPPAYSPLSSSSPSSQPSSGSSSPPPVPEQRSPASDRAGRDDADEPGGWTQMYGPGSGSSGKDD